MSRGEKSFARTIYGEQENFKPVSSLRSRQCIEKKKGKRPITITITITIGGRYWETGKTIKQELYHNLNKVDYG